MLRFPNPYLAVATADDIPSLVNLLNGAYRGENSKQGWTTEAHLIAGDVRTNEENLYDVMQLPASIMVKYTDASGKITGCVKLQHRNNKIYLGILSVSPQLQGAGIGKQLLLAAEE